MTKFDFGSKPTVQEMQTWNKRYKLGEDTARVIDTFDDGEYWTVHGNEAYNLCIDMNALFDENEQLKSENNMLKVTIGRNEGYIDRLTHQAPWGNRAERLNVKNPTTKEKTTIEEVIGIVKTDEQTDSVKEIRKLRGRDEKIEKRFTMDDDVGMLDVACCNIYDNGEFLGTVILSYGVKFCDLLNQQHKENKDGDDCYRKLLEKYDKLKEENKRLKHSNEHYKQWFRDNEIKEIIVGDCKVILND